MTPEEFEARPCWGKEELFIPDEADMTAEVAEAAQNICSTCPAAVFAWCEREVEQIRRAPSFRLYGTWAGVTYGVPGRPLNGESLKRGKR